MRLEKYLAAQTLATQPMQCCRGQLSGARPAWDAPVFEVQSASRLFLASTGLSMAICRYIHRVLFVRSWLVASKVEVANLASTERPRISVVGSGIRS